MTTDPFVTPGYTRTHLERRDELRPNFQGRTYKAALNINSYGLRDEDRPISGENQAYRLAVFGDSITFGIGAKSEDTFPKLMERILNDAYDSEIQVFNFGVPSYNTVNEYHLGRLPNFAGKNRFPSSLPCLPITLNWRIAWKKIDIIP